MDNAEVVAVVEARDQLGKIPPGTWQGKGSFLAHQSKKISTSKKILNKGGNEEK